MMTISASVSEREETNVLQNNGVAIARLTVQGGVTSTEMIYTADGTGMDGSCCLCGRALSKTCIGLRVASDVSKAAYTIMLSILVEL